MDGTDILSWQSFSGKINMHAARMVLLIKNQHACLWSSDVSDFKKNAYTNRSLTTVISRKNMHNQPKYISCAGTALYAALATWQNIFFVKRSHIIICFVFCVFVHNCLDDT
jgi:hypothetical protein